MWRICRWLSGSVLLLALIFVVTTLVTLRPGDRSLYPPTPGSNSIEVEVVSNGYHAGLVFRRADAARFASKFGDVAILALASRFAGYQWLEVGWGDEDFYRHVPTAAAVTVGLAARALFRPDNASVLHVVGLNDDPRRAFSHADFRILHLSDAGFGRLLAKVDASFVRGSDGHIAQDLGPGLYGPSLFFRATGHFNIFHVCNHWVADALDAAGVPTAPVAAILPVGLFLDLRWRSGVMSLP